METIKESILHKSNKIIKKNKSLDMKNVDEKYC